MEYPVGFRCRVLVDFNDRGDVLQIGWERWDGGEMTAMGMMPVSPFDSAEEVERELAKRLGVQVSIW